FNRAGWAFSQPKEIKAPMGAVVACLKWHFYALFTASINLAWRQFLRSVNRGGLQFRVIESCAQQARHGAPPIKKARPNGHA
ncbi:MAG: hypothetical protein WBC68_03390, partial [Albidovulum sp.]